MLDGIAWFPANRRAELGGIGNQQGLVDRTHPRGINSNRNGLRCLRAEVLQCIGDLGALTAAKIIDLARLAVLPQKPVGTNDVANVNEVTNDIEVANLQALALAAFYLSHMSASPAST